jgi:ParB family transcriptional regulator, chromosome partitioning protein
MNRRKLLLANNPLLSGPSLKDRGKPFSPYKNIDLELLIPDPSQPRREFDDLKLKELADSIAQYGVVSPILVRPNSEGEGFVVIAGERRLRAAKLAGLTSIPAIINQETDDETKRLAIQLVENIQRENLTSLERAQGMAILRDSYQLSIREIAHHLGVSKSMVQRSLELLELPDDLFKALQDGVSESKVLLLAQIEDKDIRASYLREIDFLPRNELVKELAKQRNKTFTKNSSHLSEEENVDDIRVSEEIQRNLGLKVRIQRTNKFSDNGKLVVDFYSNEDLQEIFRRLVAVD